MTKGLTVKPRTKTTRKFSRKKKINWAKGSVYYVN